MPIEGQEYLLTKKGRYRCLVCQGRPVYSNLKLFREHRHLKQHAGRLKEWRAHARARMVFEVNATQGLKRSASGEEPAAKRRRLDNDLVRRRQKEFTKVLKATKKCYLKDVLEKIREVAPKGIKKKPNGKRTISAPGIKSPEALLTLINFCESFRCRDISQVDMAIRKNREWQLVATIAQSAKPRTDDPHEHDREADDVPDAKEDPNPPTNPSGSAPDSKSPPPPLADSGDDMKVKQEEGGVKQEPGAKDTKTWRSVVVAGNSTLHDLSKILAFVFDWLPEKFDYRPNTGKAYGQIRSSRAEIQAKLGSKVKLQKVFMCQAMLSDLDWLEWKYADHTIRITLDGVCPSHDPLKRDLPRIVGGAGRSPCYDYRIQQHWTKGNFDRMTVFEMNRTMVDKRAFAAVQDNLKLVKEWERDLSYSLRRAAPVVAGPKGGLCKPWTDESFLYPPFTEKDTEKLHVWVFDAVQKANVLHEPNGDFVGCVPADTEILVDEFRDHHVHMYHPLSGWLTIRNEKGIRALMPRMGRHTVLPGNQHEE